MEDDGNYINHSYHLLDQISHHDPKFFPEFLTFDHHPHLTQLTGAGVLALLSLFKADSITALIVLTMGGFLAILLYSTYWLGKQLFTPEAGLLAALLLSCSPVVFGFSRMFMLDMPLAAMLALTCVLLLKTEYFRHLRWVLAAALATVLGFLTKETMVLFFFPLAIYYCARSLRLTSERRLRARGILIFSILTISPLALLLIFNPNRHLLETYYNLSLKWRAAPAFLFYMQPDRIILLYAGFFLAVVLLPLAVVACKNIKQLPLFLLLWIIAPLILFSLSGNQTMRFLIPLLPPVFLILAAQPDSLPRRLQRYSRSIMVLCAFSQLIYYSFFLTPDKLTPFLGEYEYAMLHDSGRILSFRHPDYDFFTLINNYFKMIPSEHKRPLLFFLYSSEHIDLRGIEGNLTITYSQQRRHSADITSRFEIAYEALAHPCWEATRSQIQRMPWRRSLLACDYFLILHRTSANKFVHPDSFDNMTNDAIVDAFNQCQEQFEHAETIQQGECKIEIYRNKDTLF